jgi:hypothetical protein
VSLITKDVPIETIGLCGFAGITNNEHFFFNDVYLRLNIIFSVDFLKGY